MKTSLIPPAQLWDFGITVDIAPKQYSDGRSLHGVHHPDCNVPNMVLGIYGDH
jgi:hypothetical protein